eukprot:GDKI01014987.1.p3 GENE.GDKI01014987.1~~GDKI01014987.1.p3  ORF type:complete len:103 (-),score=1.76 GDKI01014987.1:26-334(-)
MQFVLVNNSPHTLSLYICSLLSFRVCMYACACVGSCVLRIHQHACARCFLSCNICLFSVCTLFFFLHVQHVVCLFVCSAAQHVGSIMRSSAHVRHIQDLQCV